MLAFGSLLLSTESTAKSCSPDQLVASAEQRFAAADYKGAVALLSEALRLKPANSRALGIRAMCFEKLNQTAVAHKDVDNGLRLSPGDAGLLWVKGGLFAKEKDWRAAVQFYDRSLAVDPADTNVLYSKAIALGELKDYRPAIDVCTQALQRSKNNEHFIALRSGFYFHSGSIKQAMADTDMVIKANPRNWWAREARFNCLMTLGRVSEALHEAEIGSKLNPAESRFWTAQASCKEALGADRSAIQLVTEAIHRGDRRAYELRAKLYSKTRQWSLAVADLEELIKDGRTDDWIFSSLRRAYESVADKKKVQVVREKFIQSMPQGHERNRVMIDCCLSNEDYRAAIEIAKQDFEISNSQTDSCQRLVFLAHVYEAAHKQGYALESAIRAMKIQPEDPEACATTALILASLRKPRESLRLCDKFLEGHDSLTVSLARMRALEQLGKYDEAIRVGTACLKRAPDNIRALALRALAEYRLQRYSLCLADCRKIAALDASGPIDVKLASACLYHLNDLHGCIRQISVAIDASPRDGVLLASRGFVYMKLGDFSNALKDLELSLRLRPDSEAFAQRGKILWAQGKSREALTSLSRAIELQPGCQTYRLRAQVYRSINKPVLAAQDEWAAVKLENRCWKGSRSRREDSPPASL